ncbi:MAG: MG2 domain-containing protein [Bacteroidota bacterium]
MNKNIPTKPALWLIMICLLVFSSCKNNAVQNDEYGTFNPEFASFISGYTTGEISRTEPVIISFSKNVIPREQVGEEATKLFKINPQVKGTLKWKSQQSLEFIPENPLESATLYQVSLNTRSLKDSLPNIPSPFNFQFKTYPQGLNVEFAGLKNIDLKNFEWSQLSGKIISRDFEPNASIESIFEAELGNKPLKISWDHEEDNYVHAFTIDSILRTDQTQFVNIHWDGNRKNIAAEGEEKIEVPSMGSFKYMSILVYNHPEQYIQVEFSDPVDKDQNLNGLIYLKGVSSSISVNSNLVRVYPKSTLTGAHTLHINQGLQNLAEISLGKDHTEDLQFEDPKPEIRITGKGAIIPQGETLPFVFETMGLQSVDVRIIKVYENNILQFLQGNSLDGRDQINRVGQVIVRESVSLDKLNSNGSVWTRHSLDLSKLVEPEPGAIYEVALGFRPQDILFKCEEIANADQIDMLRVGEDFNSYYWYDEGYYYYNWDERDNPCNRAYYRSERVVKRNVLASNLGLIAKQGNGENLFLVTDLKTTAPLPNVKLELYDFQQQLIGTTVTDSEGKGKIPTDKSPFVLVAQAGSQRGYLRLDDGHSLSLSRFDIGGTSYREGLKGFLYGERGVWRPGDDIFLTFILEDKENKLPQNHPVKLELRDPKGKLVIEKIKTEGVDGFYTFPVKTDSDAPTGNYRAYVSVGGAQFYKTVKVETITPNRLKIQLDMGAQSFSQASQPPNVTLQANWLHGAAANNLKAKVSAQLRPNRARFENYEDFTFWDPIRKYDVEETIIYEGNLNSSGQAAIPTGFSLENVAPGRLKAFIRTQVYEPGGNISTDNFSMDYHPFPVYVGIKAQETNSWRNILALNEGHTIEIATVGPDGKPRDRKGLQVKVYKLGWRWWWDRSYSDIANYQGKMSSAPVQQSTISTQGGKGSYRLQINEPDWGRYLVRVEDPSGHATGSIVYIDYPGWGSRARTGSSEGAQMLSFTSDKDTYKVGEKVTLDIPSGYKGRALVSLERAAKVIDAFWIDAQEGQTQFSFEATREMAPNIYAHVTLLQPHAQTVNDLPIRMYGVLPVFVEDPKTELAPEINISEELAPNTSFDVRISEANGQPMTYTLAVVDEGLLDITRFKTPDPHSLFYQREALIVKTWDMFDQVVGAYGGEIKSLLSIGGDGGESEDPDASKQNRFRPVVKFIGPFTLGRGKKRTHTLEMPNYVGSVRTMVIAGKEGAYGFAEQATPVKQDLMLLGSLPRVLGPGESLQLPATVFTMDDNIRKVNVSIETHELLEIEGGSTQQLNFSQSGDKLANFTVKVKPYLGKGHVKLVATSGRLKAEYETDIEVRMPNPPTSKVVAKALAPGETWKQVYNPIGVEGTNEATVEVSSIPPINLQKHIRFLIRYPYGCVEQTTSSVFPQIYLSQLTELKGQQAQEVGYNIREGIKRLQRFQAPGGGFAYWPGGEISDWGTNYAGHFLIEAEKAGYQLPFDCLSRWKSFQQQEADNWTPDTRYEWSSRSSQLTQSYRLYLLALAGSPNMGAMNRMRKYKDLYTPAKWNLVAAYYLAGQRKVAERMGKDLDVQVDEYTEQSYTYGTALRDKAIMVSALSLIGNREKATPLAEYISDRLSARGWFSTQTTAYCLIGMAHYIGLDGTPDPLQFAIDIAGKGSQSIKSVNPIWQSALEGEKSTSLSIKNTTDQVVFARLVSEGTPLQGDQTNAFNGLDMRLTFSTPNGNPIDPAQLEQGTEFIATVQVTNTGNKGTYKEMALNQIFPSGWEIINMRMYDQGNGGDRPTYQDIRDDRVYTFFNIDQGKTKTFKIRLSANYIGRYYLPTVYCEAMYDKRINAKIGGKWVEVVSIPNG